MLKFISTIEEVAIVKDDDDDQLISFTIQEYIQSVFLGIQVGLVSIPLEIVRAIIIPIFEGMSHVLSILFSAFFYGFTGRLRLTKDIE